VPGVRGLNRTEVGMRAQRGDWDRIASGVLVVVSLIVVYLTVVYLTVVSFVLVSFVMVSFVMVSSTLCRMEVAIVSCCKAGPKPNA
jgi:hypothetical protein